MKPKYLQFSCVEEDTLDLTQANAVTKHQPDIIILEYPNNNKTPNIKLNNYSPNKKPRSLINKQINTIKNKILNIQPWAKADKIMWQNIAKLWSRGHQVMIYKIDGPSELTKEMLDKWPQSYPAVMKNWLWWVRIYLREKYMAKNIQWVLNNFKEKDNPKILVFLQSFHWKNVKFLLNNPTKTEIWNYYFGNFKEINKKNIRNQIKERNKIFFKYWQKISDFK